MLSLVPLQQYWRLSSQCLITWAFHLSDVRENIIWDNSRIFHKWSDNLGSCLASEKTTANIITSIKHSIFHHTARIRGLFWQILILSGKNITGLRKLLRFVLLVVIRLLFLFLQKGKDRHDTWRGLLCCESVQWSCCQAQITAKHLWTNCAYKWSCTVCAYINLYINV